MSLPKIGIVIGTTRQGRFGDKAAQWLHGIASKRQDLAFEILDLRDYPMPIFDEPVPPVRAPARNEAAQRWARALAALDGYIFVTGEYNYGMPSSLKNALDHAYAEFNRKPAGFVAYGGVGGARAVGQLCQVAVALQLAPLAKGVNIGATELMGMLMHGKTFADFPYLDQTAQTLLDDLAWWASVLKAGREKK